jgi:hypothetical protein
METLMPPLFRPVAIALSYDSRGKRKRVEYADARMARIAYARLLKQGKRPSVHRID